MIPLCLPTNPTEDQQQTARLGQIELQVWKWSRKEMESCVGVQVQNIDRWQEKSKNHIYFEREMIAQDTKGNPEMYPLYQCCRSGHEFFPPWEDAITSAINWHWLWQTTFHRLAYSAQWHGSSWWIFLSAAVGTGGGCCRRTGFCLKTPGFHLVSDNSPHQKQLLIRPVSRI